jgi:hypothetical protein
MAAGGRCMTKSTTLFTGFMFLVLTGCGGSDGDDPYRSVASGLCEAAMKAEAGDTAGAEEVFYDIVHQPLHDLAAATSEVDRALAARLLEAKEAVESGLDTDQADVGEVFQALVAAAGEALVTTGHDGVPCAGSEDT